jgi:hypothetical protein
MEVMQRSAVGKFETLEVAMLKQIIVPILGLSAIAVAATPAAADRNRVHRVQPVPDYLYEYDARPTQRPVTTAKPRYYKRKFNPNLDFETEAVWRNLRPEWFD